MQIPPALLEAVEQDIKALQPLQRVMYAVQLNALHRKMENPDVPIGQRLAVLDHLAKAADVYPKANAQVATGPGFSVSIQINGQTVQESSKNLAKAEVIEAVEVTNDLVGAGAPDSIE